MELKHHKILRIMDGLARLLHVLGKPSEAEPLFRDAVAKAERALPADFWFTAVLRDGWGRCLTTLGRYDEAEVQLLKSHEVLKARMDEDPGHAISAIEALIDLYESSGRPDTATKYRSMPRPTNKSQGSFVPSENRERARKEKNEANTTKAPGRPARGFGENASSHYPPLTTRQNNKVDE